MQTGQVNGLQWGRRAELASSLRALPEAMPSSWPRNNIMDANIMYIS